MALKDLTGMRFGRLEVIQRAENTSGGKARWTCRCDCGKYKTIISTNLIRNKTISCGCFMIELNTIHGATHTRLFNIWDSLLSRCYNTNNKSYYLYGGIGIDVCEEWKKNFSEFYYWAIGNGYYDGLQLTRIDKTKQYSKDNCMFKSHSDITEAGMTKKRSDNKTGYVGVCFVTREEKYFSYITFNKKQIRLGLFNNINDAVEARIVKEIELFGEQRTNFHYNKEE